MFACNPDKLQALVTGVDAAASRDVVRLLSAQGASVIAADADAPRLARLERDAGLYGIHIETTEIDLTDGAEVRLWEDALRAFRRLPHLMICCCEATGAQAQDCPARAAAAILKPAIFLHAEPRRRGALSRMAALRRPTLQALLDRAPGHGLFSAETAARHVRIASRLYALHRPLGDEASCPTSSRDGAERAAAA